MGNSCVRADLQITSVKKSNQKGMVSKLKLKHHVWAKDYFGLFDYNSKDVKIEELEVFDSGVVCNREGKITIQQKTTQNMADGLFQILKEPNFFLIKPIVIQSNASFEKSLWLVIKSTPSKNYSLREKDVLKFGKQKMRVNKIVLNEKASECSPIIAFKHSLYSKSQLGMCETVRDEVQTVTNGQSSCRICLQVGSKADPIICPCSCSGSVKYIHLNCLRKWLAKGIVVEDTKPTISVKLKELQCEMCKQHYPQFIQIDEQKLSIVDIPQPQPPYLHFDLMRMGKEYTKYEHYLSFAEQSEATLGRKKGIDLRIFDDISISRHHANLTLQFKEFLLTDNSSKFGTSVLIKQNLLINPSMGRLMFQTKADLFSVECEREDKQFDAYYQYQYYMDHGCSPAILDQQQQSISQQSQDQAERESNVQ